MLFWYNKLKNKNKNLVRESAYFNYLFGALVSMFEWTVPKGVDAQWLEKWLHTSGGVVGQKVDNKWLFADAPSRVGEVDMYGEGEHVIGTVIGDSRQIKGRIGEDAFICYNNVTRSPDLAMLVYSSELAECDKAIEVNTKLSAFAPIFNSPSQTIETAIKEILSKLKDGEIGVITSENILKALQGGNDNGPTSIDLTHPERIKNVQYQSQLYDTLIRRFFSMYGLNTRSTQKLAQVSVDEINSLDCISWVLPLDMLKQRKKFCDAVNAKYNENWDVKFSEVWQQEYTAYTIRKFSEDVNRENVLDDNELERNSIQESA